MDNSEYEYEYEYEDEDDVDEDDGEEEEERRRTPKKPVLPAWLLKEPRCSHITLLQV